MRADAMLIRVQSRWDDWRTAEVRFDDLHDVHWLQPTRAPHALVHGYVSCSNIVTGELPHRCDHPSAPHRLLVCILKKHTMPSVYAELARHADQPRTCRPDRPAVMSARPPLAVVHGSRGGPRRAP